MADVEIIEDTFGVFPPHPDSPSQSQEIIRRFTLTNKMQMKVQIISYGATITSLRVPDKNGQEDDVVLGFDDMDGYLGAYGRNPYFGAVIGRVANRTGNAKFSLGEKEYKLSVNTADNLHHLHGGIKGFDKRNWESHVEGKRVTFSYLSRDGEEGYPGEVLAHVTYELTQDNQLIIDYQATTTKPTPINLTNHSYFNLSCHKEVGKELEGHFVLINADNITPLDSQMIATGKIEPVNGLYDLRKSQNLHELLKKFPKGNFGYDINYCLNRNTGETVRLAGRVQDLKSGRVLEVYTDQPGVQFYTSNFFPEKETPLLGKEGAKYSKHGAFCLETQQFPNAVNIESFPNPVIKPGDVYNHKAIFRFFTSPN